MWMNLENMLSERNQTQKIVYCMTQLYGNIQNRQIHRYVARDQERGKWGKHLLNEFGGFCGGDENILEFSRNGGCTGL